MPKTQPVEYQAAVPAFLQRLKEGNAALDGRHNVQVPRARGGMNKGGRLDMGGEEGEDDPVMLDESGNMISKEEVEALEKETKGDEPNDATIDKEGGPENARSERQAKEEHVSSGFIKKRKAVKIVGDGGRNEHDDDADALEGPTKSMKDSTNDLQTAVAQHKEDAKKEVTISSAKKAKRKKIKLSFDEPE